MSKAPELDRDLLHQILWRRAQPLRRTEGERKLKLSQKVFAAEIHVAQTHLNRIIREFVEAGRLVRTQEVGVYRVRDPLQTKFWKPDDTIRWGGQGAREHRGARQRGSGQ